MIRGIYTSGWSMLANTKQMDIISNNLANVNTNGYKKDTVIYESFPETLIKRINDSKSTDNPSGRVGSMHLGNDVGEVFTYYTRGQLIKTDNSLDMAIADSDLAFFTVAVPLDNGNYVQRYTRNGAFALNANGQLVTKEGYFVMGQGGIITLESDDFTVLEDGTVTENGRVVERLLISEFENENALRKIGENLIEAAGVPANQFSGAVKQGYIEQSNVNAINEMVNMITVMRAYEANQKVFHAQDETLAKAVNEVGRIK